MSVAVHGKHLGYYVIIQNKIENKSETLMASAATGHIRDDKNKQNVRRIKGHYLQ